MMTNPSDILVYWGDGSPPCMSILITLEEKNLQGYKQKCLSFDRKENRSEEVLAINPRGQLPTCKIGDLVINESLAMCKYLQENNVNQGTNLEPSDPEMRGIMWQRLCEFMWNLPRRCYKNYVRYLWDTPSEELDQKKVNILRTDFITEMKLWENYLKENSDGSFIVGSQFTLADIIIFPWIAFFVALGLNLSAKFPKIDHYYQKMLERPSVKATFPKNWDGSIDTTVLRDIHEYA